MLLIGFFNMLMGMYLWVFKLPHINVQSGRPLQGACTNTSILNMLYSVTYYLELHIPISFYYSCNLLIK